MKSIAAILGNTNIDLILRPVSRMPLAGEEILVEEMETRAAGAALYTATTLDRLGIPCSVVGAVGDDAWGEFIRQNIQKYKRINTSGIERISGTTTGISVAFVDEDGNRRFISYPGALSSFDLSRLARLEKPYLRAPFVLVCGYFFMPALFGEPLLSLLRRCRSRGSLTMLDTGWAPKGWSQATRREVLSLLREVDIFLPNLAEAKELTDKVGPLDCARSLLEQGTRAVAIKMGADGSLWLDGRTFEVVPARPTVALDTTGAGDAFNAALIYGVYQRWAIRKCLEFANALCSDVIGQVKRQIPSVAKAHERLATSNGYQ